MTETSASVASQTEATAAATSSSAASLERKPAVVVPALLGVAAWFL